MNWKTTLAGAIAALATVMTTLVPEAYQPIAAAVVALALAVLGYHAKDK